jgi:hypothetical protein
MDSRDNQNLPLYLISLITFNSKLYIRRIICNKYFKNYLPGICKSNPFINRFQRLLFIFLKYICRGELQFAPTFIRKLIFLITEKFLHGILGMDGRDYRENLPLHLISLITFNSKLYYKRIICNKNFKN